MTDAVLILGAGGFVGRALTKALSREGRAVIAVGDTNADHAHAGVEYIPHKIGEAAALAPLLERASDIVHLATTSTPGTSAAKPLREVRTNLAFTATLLEAMQELPGKRLLYFSSGGSLYAEDHEGIASTERSAVRPRSYHGAGKLAAELFIAAWCSQFKGSATVVRPSNIYGPGQPERAGFGVVPTAMGKLLRGETMHVWGDGSARRDYIYVDDLVRLCLLILASSSKPGIEIVNACSGESTSLNDLLQALETITGRTLTRTNEESRTVDARHIAMDPEEAARLYGWTHQTPLADGLANTWQWFLERQ